MKLVELSGGRVVRRLTDAERRVSERTRWQHYERAKRAWCAAHPDATSAEFDHAMRKLAARLAL